tara:strand:- start:247 stop:459 length:213 start_codon:yes stop_codon:yes gene_type:complete
LASHADLFENGYRTDAQLRDPSSFIHEISIASLCSILSSFNSVFDEKQILFYKILMLGCILIALNMTVQS